MENVAQEGKEDAQAIIIAAFLVAIGILVLSVFLNGLIFSQNLATRDEGADERNILEVNQGTQDAVRTAMTGNRTTPDDAEDEFDLFMNLYEEGVMGKYRGRQSAVSLGPTGSGDSDLNFSDVKSSPTGTGTLAWALGQKCDLDDSLTDCSIENATGSPDWNAVEDNTGNAGNAFTSPRKFVFTVEKPGPGDTFQVDAVKNEGAPRNFDTTVDATVGDWRMVVDNNQVKFEKVDSLLPSLSPPVVKTNTTTVLWGSIDGDTARIDILNEEIDGEDVASIGSSGPFDATSTYPEEIENDPDKGYLRFWDGDVAEGTYDIRIDDAAFENDLTGPCDAPCSAPGGDRGVYAFGVVHEVEGIRANYTDAGTTHTTEIGATLRQEDLILEER